jgi:hypothetical protein
MNPPFSADQFFEVFAAYNDAVWPAQLVLLVLGFAEVALARHGNGVRARVISFVLGLLWAWMAVVYHWAFFTTINPAAVIFGVLFLVQAGLLFRLGLRGPGLSYDPRPDVFGYVGAALIAYGLLIYPILGSLSGREFLSQPSFGLPCPTVIFTVGLLLWAKPRVPPVLLVVPAAWSLVGFTAVRAFGVLEDIMLPAAAFVGGALILWRNRRTRGPAVPRDPAPPPRPSRVHPTEPRGRG